MGIEPRFEIRGATSDDAVAIATIELRGWQSTYRGVVPDSFLDPATFAERLERWNRVLAPEDGRWTQAAVIAEEVVGYCSVAAPTRDQDAADSTAEIVSLYVATELIRKGIGGALMDAALTTLAADDWSDVTLWMFRENPSARAFYENVGFVADGREGIDPVTGQPGLRMRIRL
jgi:ribosomal protein S18 acetylase RimI-like enzyme